MSNGTMNFTDGQLHRMETDVNPKALDYFKNYIPYADYYKQQNELKKNKETREPLE